MEEQTKKTLQTLADNETLTKAVETLFLEQFILPDFPDDISNERLGEVVRAYSKGRQKVEEAFRIIRNCKTEKIKPINTNFR